MELLAEVQDFLKVEELVHETTMDLLAVGVRESKLGLDSMIVDPKPLLQGKGLL